MSVLVAGCLPDPVRVHARTLGYDLRPGDLSASDSEERPEGILAGSPEMLSAAAQFAVTHDLIGLGLSASHCLSGRRALRERLEKGGVPQVPFRYAVSFEEAVDSASDLEGPFYVVPAVGCSDAESVAEYREDLPLALRRVLSPDASAGVIIESHPPGRVFSVWSVVVRGSAANIAIVQHESAPRAYRFPVGLRCPANLDGQSEEHVNRCAAEAIRALEVDSGVLRIDVLGDADECRVLAVEAALAWTWPPVDLVSLAGGLDVLDATLRIATGRAVEIVPPNAGAAIGWLRPRSGRVVSIAGLNEARAMDGVVTVEVHVSVGDVLRHAVDLAGRDRVGFVAATGSDASVAASRVDAALRCCRIETTTIV